MSMPPAALARLKAIRATMPAVPEPPPASRIRPRHEWLDGGRTIAVVRVRRAEDPIAQLAKPERAKIEIVNSARERVKRREWPDPGGVRWAFEDARRKR